MMLIHKREDAVLLEKKGDKEEKKDPGLSSPWERIMVPGPIHQLN